MQRRISYLLVWALAACRDGSDARGSLVDTPRILAMQLDPPEVAPNQRVTYRVLAVDGDGAIDTTHLTLSYCQTPKLPSDNRIASDPCAQSVERRIPTRDGEATAQVPGDACVRFGPNVPATVRAPDPDASGGYYQPVRAAIDEHSAVAMLRLRCPLANAPLALTREFRERYVPNQNPELMPLSAAIDGEPVALDALPRGREITLSVGWSAMSRERYVVYDSERVQLREQYESLRVSWFVTDGELAFDHTGRTADEPTHHTDNRWVTPQRAGRTHLWLVLRDERGGSTHAAYVLDVR